MTGRPPPVPAQPGFSQGWTTTAAKATAWRRSQSASSLRPSGSKTRLLDNALLDTAQQSTGANGYQSPLRGAGVEVVRTPESRKASHDASDRSATPDENNDRDVHADCRSRIYVLSTELAEATQALKSFKKDQEKLLRQVSIEREDFRKLQKTHAECDQLTAGLNSQLQRYAEQISLLQQEKEQQATRFLPWEQTEEQMVANLQESLRASEERERNLQTALDAEKVTGKGFAGRLQEALRNHEHSERTAEQAREGAKAKECRFTELQDEVCALRTQLAAKDKSLSQKCSEFDALRTEHFECSRSQSSLAQELHEYQNSSAAEVNAEFAKCKASSEEEMQQRVAELVAEKEESKKQAAAMKRTEAAANVFLKTIQKRLSASEVAQSDSRATVEAKEKELQDLQTKCTKSASKKEEQVRLLQTQLEQSKTEIVELYDALVRAGENNKVNHSSGRKSVKH